MADFILPGPNSASTLSLFANINQDFYAFNTNSDSLATLGNFRVFTNLATQATGATETLSFSPFSTINSLSGSNLSAPTPYYVLDNELTLDETDPFSYCYFASFYTEISNSINSILANYPYPIFLYDAAGGNSIYNYSQFYNNITGQRTSSFQIPISAISANQGNIILNTSNPLSSQVSLVTAFTGFCVQMSATTTSATTVMANITSYLFSSDTNGNNCLFISTDNFLDYMSASTSNLPLYIRPNLTVLGNYNMGLSKLENNLLYVGQFQVPSAEIAYSSSTETFIWPKTIDNLAPDSYGDALINYQNSLLASAATIDMFWTNKGVEHILPSNFLERDSPNAVYASLMQASFAEFDIIKQYIQNISYAHTVTYNGQNMVPLKFLHKLSDLLGWKIPDHFSDVNLLEYLVDNADGIGNSFDYYNLEIWKRILVNINWIYRRKGTRAPIEFIFNLLGGPSCLLLFDEHTYNVPQTFGNSPKINPYGYINYDASTYYFEAGTGGIEGRGDGQLYRNQWLPEFDLQLQIDNVKVYTGTTTLLSGLSTQNVANTKIVSIGLDPARLIECDVKSYYLISGSTWNFSADTPPFSAMNVSYEMLAYPEIVQPYNLSAMTVQDWLTYIYENSIDPRDHKTLGWPQHALYYQELKNAYLNYYYNQYAISNELTFRRLQPLVDLLELNFQTYLEELIPATTILDSNGIIYRNTEFNRQKFVYPPGIDAGSLFQIPLPPSFAPKISPTTIISQLNGFIAADYVPVTISSQFNDIILGNIKPVSIESTYIATIGSSVSAQSMTAEIHVSTTQTFYHNLGPQ